MLFSLLLILFLRLFWVFPGAHAAHFIRTRLLHQNEKRPEARQVFVVGWTGMRGVLALAAAMSLPRTVANGSPFPHRDLIVFLTFSVILVTLVLQGLTLPWLIRVLGLDAGSGPNCEQQKGRRLVLQAALTRLDDMRQSDPSVVTEQYEDLVRHYEHRLASIGDDHQGTTHAQQYFRFVDLSRALLDVEREAALRLWDEGRIADEVLREMEYEMDLNETRLIAAAEYQTAGPRVIYFACRHSIVRRGLPFAQAQSRRRSTMKFGKSGNRTHPLGDGRPHGDRGRRFCFASAATANGADGGGRPSRADRRYSALTLHAK